MALTHFPAMLLFALVVSAAFAVISRRGWKEQVKYALWCFLLFVLVGVGIGWAMYPISR
jgi:cytochrome bd-type quinol oxidase subunit 2